MNNYAKLEFETGAQGNEAGAGGGVFATPFYLPATEIGIAPNPQPLSRADEIRGIEGLPVLASNEYEPDGSVSMRAYGRYIGALLFLLFGDVTTTAGGVGVTDPDGANVPVGANLHVFKKKTGSRPATAQLTRQFNAARWLRARGVSLSSLALSLDEDGVKAEGNLMANYVSRLTVDPVDVVAQDALSILPFRRRNVVVTVGDSGTVDLQSIECTMEQSLQYNRDMGSRTGWPTDTERENSPEGFLRLTGSLTRRDFDPADWDVLISTGIFSLSIAAISEQNIGATAKPYGLWITTASCQFTGGGPEGLKNQPRHESSYDWQAGATGPGVDDFTVTVVNDVTAYK